MVIDRNLTAPPGAIRAFRSERTAPTVIRCPPGFDRQQRVLGAQPAPTSFNKSRTFPAAPAADSGHLLVDIVLNVFCDFTSLEASDILAAPLRV